MSLSLPALPGLQLLDWVFLAVLTLSVIAGLVRGFIFECLSLAGWVVAWFAAQWAAPWVAAYVPVFSPESPVRMGLAFVLAFVAALVVWSVLARLVRMALHATPLSIADRLLGAGFGLLRGVVLLLAVATVVALTPASQSQGWRASQGARWLESTLFHLKPLLPEPVARLLRA